MTPYPRLVPQFPHATRPRSITNDVNSSYNRSPPASDLGQTPNGCVVASRGSFYSRTPRRSRYIARNWDCNLEPRNRQSDNRSGTHLRSFRQDPLISLSKFRQLSDLPTYVKTLHQMHIHYPSLVLVPDTFISPHSSSDAKTSLLIDCIEDEFEGVPIEPVKRKYWNETAGGPSDRCRDGHPSLREFI